MPYVSRSGVRLDASSGIVVGRKKRIAFSKRDRTPYWLIGAPSARGSAGGGAEGLDRHAATALPSAAPSPRNQRRDLSGTARTIIRSMRKSTLLFAATASLVSLLAMPRAHATGAANAALQTAANPNGWQIPENARDEKSPLTATPAVLKKGKSIYDSKCQKCHGPQGKGDGPDGDSEHKPADLTDASRATRNTDGVLFYKVWNGRQDPKMPAFKSELGKDDVWAVVEYAKSLRKAQ